MFLLIIAGFLKPQGVLYLEVKHRFDCSYRISCDLLLLVTIRHRYTHLYMYNSSDKYLLTANIYYDR